MSQQGSRKTTFCHSDLDNVPVALLAVDHVGILSTLLVLVLFKLRHLGLDEFLSLDLGAGGCGEAKGVGL
jgi:hypothetical protein